ncbi:HK97 gp10 family phage protein [Rouxiella badensis]|uniref:HK97-gp10 family putative phage morphogenesis protein n=1 Tax=Rouxiella badensis TaxID=1646377 RepID=UPI001D146195|nr:HK97-gp10 family putative phage morphogenesis protein [Rouxiella badensis]MCC3703485.1 HK97 gp10 family phage protein [Rouxiella badensis]
MIDTKLDFSGLLDISQDLEVLSKAESRDVLRQATRAGAAVFRDEVAAKAPRLTGKLARNVVVLSHRNRNGTASAGVHIRGTNPRTGNSDNTMKASNKNNAFYWRFVEMGTSKMPAHPFVRPAYSAKEGEATDVAFAKMNEAIDKVLSK